MKIFLDTADIDQIRKYAEIGIIDGVTTNPAILAQSGRHFRDVVDEIIDIVDGPISGEVVSLGAPDMIKEARALSNIHRNIVVKLPAIPEGFKALKVISSEGIKTNFTVVYTANQALLAAKNGATYVSPFVGRLEANAGSHANLIEDIACIFKNYSFTTKILAASMRNVVYVKEAALAGAHVATIPPAVLEDMMRSDLSEVALAGFLKEWETMPADKKNIFGPDE